MALSCSSMLSESQIFLAKTSFYYYCSGGSTAASSAIVRPVATGVTGRPSIANTTNIDTLLNARQKSGIVDSPVAPSDKVSCRD